MRSWPTSRPGPSPASSTGSWPLPTTASAGGGTGSTSSATPTRSTPAARGGPRTSPIPGDIAESWRYRDWVVAAFNRDLPYDEFMANQVAGDLLPAPAPADFNAEGT